MLAQELKIYRDTYKLAETLLDIVPNFDKKFRFVLGDKIIEGILDLLEILECANSDIERRREYLTKYLCELNRVKALIRLGESKRQVTIKQMARISEITEAIGKQATAWKNKYHCESLVSQGERERANYEIEGGPLSPARD